MSKIIVAIIFMGMGIIACGCEKKVDLEDDTMLTFRRMIKNSSSASKLAPVEKALQLYENGVVDTKPLLLRAFVRFERGKFTLITYDEDRNLAGFEIIEKDISGDIVLKEKYPVLINDSFDYEVATLTWPAKQRQAGDVADKDKIEEFLKTGRSGQYAWQDESLFESLPTVYISNSSEKRKVYVRIYDKDGNYSDEMEFQFAEN